jgi:hypothetical protein
VIASARYDISPMPGPLGNAAHFSSRRLRGRPRVIITDDLVLSTVQPGTQRGTVRPLLSVPRSLSVHYEAHDNIGIWLQSPALVVSSSPFKSIDELNAVKMELRENV